MMTTLNCDEIRQTLYNSSTLLNVCAAVEYDEGALPNAQHIPLSVLPAMADEQLNRDESIVLYSRSEGRAIIAEKILSGLGFTDVTNLGDMQHCQQHGYQQQVSSHKRCYH
jgi:rhodanese-related sulfurtransferase